MTKEAFEKRINESVLFQPGMVLDEYAYETEKNQVLEDIYLYKTTYFKDSEEYAMEIVEVFQNCLKYYDASKGTPFTRYYNHALKLQLQRSKAAEAMQMNTGGMHFSASMKQKMTALLDYLNMHPDMTVAELQADLNTYAKTLEMSEEEFKETLRAYASAYVKQADKPMDEDNQDETLMHQIASDEHVETDILSAIAIQEKMDLCEQLFLKSRKSSQPVIAMKLTNSFLSATEDPEVQALLKHKAFFSEDVYQRIIECGHPLIDKDLYTVAGKSQHNFSQIWSRFVKSMQIAANAI